MPQLGLNKDFEPFHDFILIKPIPRGETEGGIALPDDVDPNLPIGKVMRVGPGGFSDGGQRLPMPCAEGDMVFLCFPSYGQPAEVEIDCEDYLLARARDIAGRLITKVA